jgi:hypothetical protein
MSLINTKKQMIKTAGTLMLAWCLFGVGIASALTLDPDADLVGIPKAGTPSFVFNDTGNDYSGTIQSWYDNILYITLNDAADGYDFYGYNTGAFTFNQSSTTSYAGDGYFYLQGQFDLLGNLFPNGTVEINGVIPDLLITNPEPLMSAAVTSFNYLDNLVGFKINGITCNSAIIGCLTGPESVYFQTAVDFPDIAALAGNDFRTTMAGITTVPVPASVWLMLSGLGLLGRFARRKKLRRLSDQLSPLI